MLTNKKPGADNPGPDDPDMKILSADAVPADTFSSPTVTYEIIILSDISRIVMVVGICVRIVLSVERNSSVIIRIPADTFVKPAVVDKVVPLGKACRIVMLAGVSVVQSVNRRIRE